MNAQHLYVLDLHPADGMTGYRIEWNVETGQLALHARDAGRVTHCKHDVTANPQKVGHLLTTAWSVATAVRDDEVDGYLRAYFVDGYARVEELNLETDFDLADPSSNRTLLCSLVHACGETSDPPLEIHFLIALEELEACVNEMLALVLQEHISAIHRHKQI